MINLRGVILVLAAISGSSALAADGVNWAGTVARMIAGRQNYPRSAQIRGEQGTTRLRVALATDGRIGAVQLAASSGSAILDREAETIVTKIGKFPAPPSGITSLIIPIVWRLE